MDYDPRIKLNVFEGNTTYSNSYRRVVQDKRQKHLWPRDRREKPLKSVKPFHRDDPETFIQWHDVYVPFNLYIKPRPIIDTKPDTKIPQLTKPVDTEKEEVIKSRPRLYVSPGIGLDDIEDPETRKSLCQYTYTSEWTSASKEAQRPETVRPMPTSLKECGRDPVAFRPTLNRPLPLGWREKGKAWDVHQTRGFVDPTEAFWLNKMASVKCGACVDPYKGVVPQETKDEILKLINKDKLRLGHDYLMAGYTGYKPRIPFGVELSKVNPDVTDPLLSTSQSIVQRYLTDKYS